MRNVYLRSSFITNKLRFKIIHYYKGADINMLKIEKKSVKKL